MAIDPFGFSVPLIGGKPDTVAMPTHEMAVMAQFDALARKYGWRVICNRCDNHVRGDNPGVEQRAFSVACGCREYRSEFATPPIRKANFDKEGPAR